jgi:putative phosphoesterase
MKSIEQEDAGVIGVISDTHGLLRAEAADILKGVDMIVHAGDICSADILNSLEKIAPVTAVCGNMDGGVLRNFLEEEVSFGFKGIKFHLIHDLTRITISPESKGVRMVINGHTHVPQLLKKNGIMYLNPGSAGPERPGKPISLARVTVSDGRLLVRHFTL